MEKKVWSFKNENVDFGENILSVADILPTWKLPAVINEVWLLSK